MVSIRVVIQTEDETLNVVIETKIETLDVVIQNETKPQNVVIEAENVLGFPVLKLSIITCCAYRTITVYCLMYIRVAAG